MAYAGARNKVAGSGGISVLLSSRAEGEGPAYALPWRLQRTMMYRSRRVAFALSTPAGRALRVTPGTFSALERGSLSFRKERDERKHSSPIQICRRNHGRDFSTRHPCLVEKRRTSCAPPAGSPIAERVRRCVTCVGTNRFKVFVVGVSAAYPGKTAGSSRVRCAYSGYGTTSGNFPVTKPSNFL